MGSSTKVEMYAEYLREEGYKPTIDGENVVRFKEEGRIYCILVDAQDPQFFRIIFPNFWEIRGQEQRMKVLAAADAATGKTKVAKVFTVDNDVWASIEIFLPSPEQFRSIFPRSMGALKAAVGHFVAKMREDTTVSSI
jgi:hypothetical protein